MASPKGNQYWKLRKPENAGRNKIFKTPNDLLQKAYEYFQWIDDNPFETVSTTTTNNNLGMSVTEKKDVHRRPYTWSGFYVFAGVFSIEAYRERKDYSEVIKEIDDIIFTQKFEGATAGLFNSNIIARDLGLRDSKDLTTNGKELNVPVISLDPLSDEGDNGTS